MARLGCCVLEEERGLRDWDRFEMVVRSWKNCGLWLLFTLLPGVIVLWRGADATRELLIAMGALSLFGIQGLLAELIGIRIGESGLSFPKRISPKVPFFVAWRRSVPSAEISRIDTGENGGLRLSLTSSEVVDVPVPGDVRAREVVRFTRQFY